MEQKDCYKCTKRKIGCHCNCEVYADFLKRQDVIKNNRSLFIFLNRRNDTVYGRKR